MLPSHGESQELRCLGAIISGGFPVWFSAIHFVRNPRWAAL